MIGRFEIILNIISGGMFKNGGLTGRDVADDWSDFNEMFEKDWLISKKIELRVGRMIWWKMTMACMVKKMDKVAACMGTNVQIMSIRRHVNNLPVLQYKKKLNDA